MKHCLLLLILLSILLIACDSREIPSSPGAFEASQGDVRVRIESDPTSPRVGEKATLTISVLDATSDEPLEGVEIRPVVDMYMATSRMLLPFEVLDATHASQITIQVMPEHTGTLRISVGIKRDGVLTPIRVPDIPIQP